MRARIIFRGLTLFTFDRPTTTTEKDPKDNNLGEMTAWLVSDPMHIGMPLHSHRPYMGFIGRDRGSKPGTSRVETKRWIPAWTTIELKDHDLAPGVTVDQSFLDYVPRLGALHFSGPRPLPDVVAALEQSKLISSRVVIPSGTIRAREFIAWDWYGNTPARVAYMDTNFQGFAANEVVVDIGDDCDIDDPDYKGYLEVSGEGMNSVQATIDRANNYQFKAELWPRVKDESDYDADPNTVEVRLDNAPARRLRPSLCGLHAVTAFEAAGYPRRDIAIFTKSDQFKRFSDVADRYDGRQWAEDKHLVIGQPFPFLIDPRADKRDGLKDVGKPGMAVDPPAPYGRQSGEGVPAVVAGGPGGHGAPMPMPAGHDPANTQICPFGRE